MHRFSSIFIAILIGSFLVGVPAYFWTSDRLGVLRTLYPVTATLTTPTLTCSADSPAWLAKASKFSLWQNNSPAGQLAYISPGGSLHECHYGWTGTPLLSKQISTDTRFRYASLTKLLTADLTLRAVQTGNLALNDLLLDRVTLPTDLIDERLNQVTVEQLLRHSAGWDRMKSVDPMVVRNRKPWCPYDLAPLAEVQLDFEPGAEYAYHNLNYCLLGVLLERSDPASTDFRTQLEREYDLLERNIQFIDGPYLADEVAYDFRNSDFYGPDYWKYFDFQALSSSMGLSGSAQAMAVLLASLGENGQYPLTSAPIEPICDETVKRGCYGYALFSYRPVGGTLRIHIQPGLLYGAPSLAIIDEHGGVTVWVGNGTSPSGSSTDAMLDHLYSALDKHYAAKSSR